MLGHLRSAAAQNQLAELVQWLHTAKLDAGTDAERPVLQPMTTELPIDTMLFRLTRAHDEAAAREMLGRRPTFFATTEAEADNYRAFADLGARGRLVMIRGSTSRPLTMASVDQLHVTCAIYAGVTADHGRRVGPFPALHIPPDGLGTGISDSSTVRIQRWIVPVVVAKALGRRLGALARTGVPEMTVAKPLVALNLSFEWREP